MTPAEYFATEMQKIAKRSEWDTESAHIDADELMCRMLEEFGYDEGVRIFRGMEKWYS